MDVEDEPNSYLKYLNDSDAPNTYLLGNNEVGLFSVEPIFTEMEATDWPQEGFPLLLTNSLITQDSTEDQHTSSQSSDKNIVDRISKCIEENLPESSENSVDNKNIEVQNIIEIQPMHDELHLDESGLELTENMQLDQENIQLKDGEIQPDETCIKLGSCLELNDNYIQLKETDVQLQENDSQSYNNVLPENEEVEITESIQFHTNDLVQLKPNEKCILVNEDNANDETKVVKLLTENKKPLPNNNLILKSGDIPFSQSNKIFTKKKTKTVNDLFSTVIANKCKICAFLCEDLEQIKQHIGEKHPEFLFTHNGISNSVSLLLSNVKKKSEQGSEVKKEYTVFVCSECHNVCIDKNDLKKHMILEHNLTMEQEESPLPPAPEEKTKKTKSAYKKTTTVLNDVNVSEVKKQEKAIQKVKCKVLGCNAGFPSDELRNVHAKLHIGETKNLFKCSECEETFKMWRIARSHMYTVHAIDFGMIVCPLCYLFKSYKAVRILRHMVIHTEQKPFQCEECGETFKQLSQLKNHEILHKTPEDMPTWCRVKKCDKCQKFFANSKSLKCHIQAIHENFKPFICNICGHKTSRKAMLELHLRQHTGSKPHKCQYCEYKAGDPNCLRKHMMKHNGAVTYQCPYCPYKCIQAGSIKSHLQHKHKGRDGTFSCKHCSYTTINAAFLHFHEKKHEISATEGANSENASAIETEKKNETDLQTDEETQSCFLNTDCQMEETVDNGGITIPAGLEMQIVS